MDAVKALTAGHRDIIHIKNSYGKTARIRALQNKHQHVVDFLTALHSGQARSYLTWTIKQLSYA